MTVDASLALDTGACGSGFIGRIAGRVRGQANNTDRDRREADRRAVRRANSARVQVTVRNRPAFGKRRCLDRKQGASRRDRGTMGL